MNLSEALRLRALTCERWSKEAPLPVAKREWELIAMEWHALASATADKPSRDKAEFIDPVQFLLEEQH
jgi:hypothetical protein